MRIRNFLDLEELWGRLNTPVYCIVNRDGRNVNHAQARRTEDNLWLYVDDVDGFDMLESYYFESGQNGKLVLKEEYTDPE